MFSTTLQIKPSRRAISVPANAMASVAVVAVLFAASWVHAQAQSDGQRYLKYVDQDIVLVFQKDPALKKKVQALLGSNYSALMGRWKPQAVQTRRKIS